MQHKLMNMNKTIIRRCLRLFVNNVNKMIRGNFVKIVNNIYVISVHLGFTIRERGLNIMC